MRHTRYPMLGHLGLHTSVTDELKTHQKRKQKRQQAAATSPSTLAVSEEACSLEGDQADVQLPQGQSDLECRGSPDLSLLAAFSRRQDRGCGAVAFLYTASCQLPPPPCRVTFSLSNSWEREEKGEAVTIGQFS